MDVLESTAIIHHIYQVCNLTQLKLDRKSWSLSRSRILTFYTIIVWIGSFVLLLHGLFADNFNDEYTQMPNNEIGNTVDFIQLIGIRVAHIITLSEALVRNNVQLKLYEKLREIDKIFECSLNVNINNSDFRGTTLKTFGIFFGIYMGSELFILGSKLTASAHHFSLYWILYLLPFLICGLRYFQIFTVISLIKCRLDKLIELLEAVTLRQKSDSAKMQQKSMPPATLTLITHSVPIFETAERLNRRFDMETPEMKRLLIIRDLYNRLWELAGIVNACFGVSMLINLGNDFVSITSNCYWIFLNYKQFTSKLEDILQIAGSAIWSLPHLCNVLMLAISCDRTVQKTTGIALGLHRIELDHMNDNQNTVIEQFSLQLLHQKITFTAASFFNVDCTLLYTIVGATTTYLIILIQFHMNEDDNDSKN